MYVSLTFNDFQSRIAGSLRLSISSLLYLVLLAYLLLVLFEINGVFVVSKGKGVEYNRLGLRQRGER